MPLAHALRVPASALRPCVSAGVKFARHSSAACSQHNNLHQSSLAKRGFATDTPWRKRAAEPEVELPWRKRAAEPEVEHPWRNRATESARPALTETEAVRGLLEAELQEHLHTHLKAALAPLTEELRETAHVEAAEATKAAGEAGRVAAEALAKAEAFVREASTKTPKPLMEAELRSLLETELPSHLNMQLKAALMPLSRELHQTMAAQSREASEAAGEAGRVAAEAVVDKYLDEAPKAFGKAEMCNLLETELPGRLHKHAQELRLEVAEAVEDISDARRAAAGAAAAAEALATAHSATPAELPKPLIQAELHSLLKSELPNHLQMQLQTSLAPLAEELRQAMAAESREAAKAADDAGRMAAETAVDRALAAAPKALDKDDVCDLLETELPNRFRIHSEELRLEVAEAVEAAKEARQAAAGAAAAAEALATRGATTSIDFSKPLVEAKLRNLVETQLPNHVQEQLEATLNPLIKKMWSAIENDVAAAIKSASDAGRQAAEEAVEKAMASQPRIIDEAHVRNLLETEFPKHLHSHSQAALAPLAEELRLEVAEAAIAVGEAARAAVEMGKTSTEVSNLMNETQFRTLLKAELPVHLEAHSKAVLAPIAEELRQVVVTETSEVAKVASEACRMAKEAASREASLISKMQALEEAAAQLRGQLKNNPMAADLDARVEKLVDAGVTEKLGPLLQDVRRLDSTLQQSVSTLQHHVSEGVVEKVDETPPVVAPLAQNMRRALVSLTIGGVVLLVAADAMSDRKIQKACAV